MNTSLSLAALLERFFTQRLMQQRQASPHTISSYRDTFRQFLKFTEQRLHKAPSQLNFQEIDAPLIMVFLDHLEKHQGVSIRSRNLRLTALHVRPGVKEHHFCRFDEQRPHRRGRGEKLYRSFYMR